jgi:hypothetical protein
MGDGIARGGIMVRLGVRGIIIRGITTGTIRGIMGDGMEDTEGIIMGITIIRRDIITETGMVPGLITTAIRHTTETVVRGSGILTAACGVLPLAGTIMVRFDLHRARQAEAGQCPAVLPIGVRPVGRASIGQVLRAAVANLQRADRPVLPRGRG